MSKRSHLLDTILKPGGSKFEEWDDKDSLIMTWLQNSMTPKVSDTCMFLTMIKKIQDSIRQTYSKVRNAAQIFVTKTKIPATKQGNLYVREYSFIYGKRWITINVWR